LSGIGGTSIVAPELAGFFAQENAYLLYIGNIVGDTCGVPPIYPCAPMGAANPYLYYFGLNPSFAAHYPFYDILSGCNSNDVTAADGLTYYCASTGYDLVTGWGTANMLQLSWAINTYLAGDFEAPSVDFSASTASKNTWYKATKAVQWLITGTSANPSYLPNGVAGYSAAWDSLPPDSAHMATPGSGDSFYTGPENPNETSGSLTLNNASGNSGEGCHTAHVRAWDNAGMTSDNTYGPVCFDDVPPVVTCGSPDGLWHAANVSIPCTGYDPSPGSGLANPSDASFSLTTSVAAGVETSTVNTNSHAVADVAGNSTTAGPLGPNKVDRKPPVVTCGSPDGLWHATDLSIACTASDGGSGLAVPGYASFTLTTFVPPNTETSSASTNSLNVYDNVGNLTVAGPFSPIKVDKKPPSIVINAPTATTYLHSATFTLNYSVTDGGSGVGTVTPTMNGSATLGGGGLANGTVVNLLTELSLGSNTFKVVAADNVGNKSWAAATFTIIATPQSIIHDVNEFQASHAISSTVAQKLLTELNTALSQRNNGQCGPAGKTYAKFILTVQSLEVDKQISPTNGSILISDAQYLINHCP